MALDDHPQAVSDEDSLDAHGIHHAGRHVIVGRHHGDLAARRFIAVNFGTVIRLNRCSCRGYSRFRYKP